jgi:hypothetical protein
MNKEESVIPMFTEGSTLDLGLTIRDYFAAHAMKTIFDFRHRELLQLNEAMGGPESMSFSEDERHSEVAEEAYLMADAMLKAREK